MMKKERVDDLIKLAWLEAWINTHGAYEKAVVKRETTTRVTAGARTRLVARLESALAGNARPVPLTVGELLRDLRAAHLFRPQEIFSRIGVSQNLYRLMEHDSLSPLKISADVWRRLMEVLNVSADDLGEMIRRTHQLVFFRPSFRGVLARYSSRKKKSMKTSDLEKAYSELYAKAKLAIPSDEEKKLDALIETLKQA